MHLSRRKALRLGVSAAIASIATRALSRELSGKRVIVIGAGIAGLAAAQTLKRQGAEIVVLEAEDYVGGRIRTDMSLGAPFEYGAGWIHGPSADNPIRQLADQVGAGTFVTDDDNLEVFDRSGNALTEAGYERFEQLYETLDNEIHWGDWSGDPRSLQAVISDTAPSLLEDPLGLWMVSAYTEFDLGAGVEDISAAIAFEDEAFEEADVILTGGYDTILAPLAEGLDIRLGTPVSRVAYDGSGVTVDGEQADYVVCTVPLGVLKSGAIRFEPGLPDAMQAAIDTIGFGTVTKIALKFDQAFWDVDTQYFGIMTEPKGRWNYWLNYRTFSDENILLGLSFGRYAPVADAMGEAEMIEDALAALRGVWGSDVGDPVAVLSTRWAAEPNFRGAYSYPKVGSSIGQFDSFQEPVANRLVMAGEHTIFRYHSTTHGALLSGQRAARQISELAG